MDNGRRGGGGTKSNPQGHERKKTQAKKVVKPQYTAQIQRYKHTWLYFSAAILGSLACSKLNQLGEAITWYDEGLAVSFDNSFFT